MADAGKPLIVRLARLRVPLGFACAIVALVFATPTPRSFAIGLVVALIGEGIRVWASGHIEKGREITRSGPYRIVRHPLYLGSAILGAGFAVASHSVAVSILAVAYLGVTLVAAMRTEEAVLDAKFAGEYTAYREGRAAAIDRPFSWDRALANREYRAVAGLAAAFLLLAWRAFS